MQFPFHLGPAFATCPRVSFRDKAQRGKNGLMLMYKPANQLTAVLCLIATAANKVPATLGTQAIRFTSGHRSAAGNSMPQDAKVSSGTTTTSVAALAMAVERPLTPAELEDFYLHDADKAKLKHEVAKALKAMPIQQSPIRLQVDQDSPDIFGDMLADAPSDFETDTLGVKRAARHEALQSETAKRLARPLAEAAANPGATSGGQQIQPRDNAAYEGGYGGQNRLPETNKEMPENMSY